MSSLEQRLQRLERAWQPLTKRPGSLADLVLCVRNHQHGKDVECDQFVWPWLAELGLTAANVTERSEL